MSEENMTIEEKLVDFENNSRVLEFKYEYRDILIWPYIRDVLFRKIVNNSKGVLPVSLKPVKRHKYRDYIKYNSYNLPKRDILFCWPSGTLVESEGQVVDRVIGDFLSSYSDSSAELVGFGKDFDIKKYSATNIAFSLDVFINQIIYYEGEKEKVSNAEMERINEMVDYLKKNIPFEVEIGIFEGVKEKAINTIKRFPSYYKYYQKLVDIVMPKLVIFNCGVYGLPQVKVLNDYGVLTAEYQHGRIDRHFDYMYGENMVNNTTYREYMPKYFLSWGNFWTHNQKLPSNIYNIGNPLVQKSIEKLKKQKSDINKDYNILFVTTDVQHSKYVEIIDYLLENLSPQYKIFVRLHPNIEESRRYYEKFFGNERVEIRNDGLIYDFFYKCKYIIGDKSTALYEAAAIGREVFILDCKHARDIMNKDFGIWIKNGQELIENINNSGTYDKRYTSEDFFGKNWEKNYFDFLQEVVYESRNILDAEA